MITAVAHVSLLVAARTVANAWLAMPIIPLINVIPLCIPISAHWASCVAKILVKVQYSASRMIIQAMRALVNLRLIHSLRDAF